MRFKSPSPVPHHAGPLLPVSILTTTPSAAARHMGQWIGSCRLRLSFLLEKKWCAATAGNRPIVHADKPHASPMTQRGFWSKFLSAAAHMFAHPEAARCSEYQSQHRKDPECPGRQAG